MQYVLDILEMLLYTVLSILVLIVIFGINTLINF